MPNRSLSLVEPSREVMSGDVHSRTEVEAVCVIALNPGVEFDRHAAQFSTSLCKGGEEGRAVATRTFGVGGGKVINVELPDRARGDHDPPACDSHTTITLEQRGKV